MKDRGRLRCSLALALLCAGATASPSAAAAAAEAATAQLTSRQLSVRIDGARRGATIPRDFMGLSFETPVLRAPAVTTRAPQLQRLLGDLGSGLLRVSGDSVDRTQWLASPTLTPLGWSIATIAPPDLANLASLVGASGWRVILGLDLGHAGAAELVEETRAAASILGPSLAGVAIGNEPDLYTHPVPLAFRSQLGPGPLRPVGWAFPDYASEVAALRSALAAAGLSLPEYGPETATARWLGSYAASKPPALVALTPHVYPLDRCHGGVLVKRAATIASLLSRRLAVRESRQFAKLMRVATAYGLALRVDETNSVACAGQPGVSDTFGAALWALDFSLRAARAGIAGLNFHGGLGSCQLAGSIQAQWYSPLCALADGQLQVRPEYYALLAMRSLVGDTFVSVSYHSSSNIAVYALRAPDGTTHVLIDDMETATASLRAGAPRPAPVRVVVQLARSYASAAVTRMSAPRASATEGATLGGTSVAADGSFGPPRAEPLAGGGGRFALTVSPASAALVTLASQAAHGAR